MKSAWKGQVFNKHAKNDLFCKCYFLEFAVAVLYIVYFFVRSRFSQLISLSRLLTHEKTALITEMELQYKL